METFYRHAGDAAEYPCADAADAGDVTTKDVFDMLVNVTRSVSPMCKLDSLPSRRGHLFKLLFELLQSGPFGVMPASIATAGLYVQLSVTLVLGTRSWPTPF